MMPFSFALARLSLLLVLLCPALARAELPPEVLSSLNAAVERELGRVEAQRAAVVEAYGTLDKRLAAYHGWCSAYGSTAVRNLLSLRIVGKLLGEAAFPARHVYMQDPYFTSIRERLDEKLSYRLPERLDVGRCGLVEAESRKIELDPKQLNFLTDEVASGTSLAYQVLAGNLRLLEGEKETLLELRGMLASSDAGEITAFLRQRYVPLRALTDSLRRRAVSGFEFGFRVPLGPLETFRNRTLGASEHEPAPGFFRLLQRRVYYVNQARLAAARLFELSVGNFTHAERLEVGFGALLQPSQIKELGSRIVPN